MPQDLQRIVQASFGNSPEALLRECLTICVELARARDGSILGEEGPHLQFLCSSAPALVGVRVPFHSIAGVTVSQGRVIYTYAPDDKRHFAGVDAQIKRTTRYLLSLPIPAIHQATGGPLCTAGVLQLLFDDNIFPDIDLAHGALELEVRAFRDDAGRDERLGHIFFLLPLVAFAMEVMKLRLTSHQMIHELKNKLISGQSWVGCLRADLRQHYPDAQTQVNIQEDFALAESALVEGAELAKTFLQYTTLDTPNFAVARLAGILQETAKAARAFASERGLKNLIIRQELADEPTPRLLDASQLKLAFFNICKNAIEALADHGARAPTLSIQSFVDGARSRVVITDNGPGMPAEVADNLFVAFKTTKAGGTGLGLTVAKKIIAMHGGTIACRTQPEGVQFSVTLKTKEDP
jgi:signal transduction histidine kinase